MEGLKYEDNQPAVAEARNDETVQIGRREMLGKIGVFLLLAGCGKKAEPTGADRQEPKFVDTDLTLTTIGAEFAENCALLKEEFGKFEAKFLHANIEGMDFSELEILKDEYESYVEQMGKIKTAFEDYYAKSLREIDPIYLQALRQKYDQEVKPLFEKLLPMVNSLDQRFLKEFDKYVPKLDDSTFDQEVLDSKGAKIVFFSGEWCGPCKTATPLVASFNQRTAGAKIVKLTFENEDRVLQNNETLIKIAAMGLVIEAFPTFILFIDGKPVLRAEGGFSSMEMIEQFLDDGMKKSAKKKEIDHQRGPEKDSTGKDTIYL